MQKMVVHISTVHPRRDTRIFYRECLSLKKAGHNVVLIIADGKGNELYKGVEIVDLGKSKNRVQNFIVNYCKIIKTIKFLNPDIVHFHDAELMFAGKRIQMLGITTFYDIHENTAMQILDKKHLPYLMRKPLHYIYKFIERMFINSFHLILAEKSYESIYIGKGKSITTILNLPDLSSFNAFIQSNRNKNEIFYIGGVTNDRGLDVIIEALKILKRKKVNFFMHYIGYISKVGLERLNIDEIKDSIKFYGRMDLVEGYEISRECKVGLAILKPINNYIESYPTKIFEYMSIRLPVITSNFPLYKAVVEEYECGFCVNPFSPVKIAEKIEEIFFNDDLSFTMGLNGRKAVEKVFNWGEQEKKLNNIYKCAGT